MSLSKQASPIHIKVPLCHVLLRATRKVCTHKILLPVYPKAICRTEQINELNIKQLDFKVILIVVFNIQITLKAKFLTSQEIIIHSKAT